MFNGKLIGSISSSVGLCLLIASTSSQATTFFTKPGFPVNSAEFGHSIAKKGKYIVVGADRHTEFGRGLFTPDDWGSERNYDNGAIYVITNDNSEPVKKYQYLKDPTLPPTAANGSYIATPLNFGSQVAISDNWIAATIPRYGLQMVPAIALIPKSASGTFPTCPIQPYITGLPGFIGTQKNWGNAIDCTSVTDVQGGVSKPIRLLTLPPSYSGKLGRTLLMKLSDSALVISDGSTVIGAHRATSDGHWQTTFSFAADAGKKIADIALSGDLLAIGVTAIAEPVEYQDNGVRDANGKDIIDGTEFVYDTSGTVYTFALNENSATSTGVITSGFLGFGRKLAINDDTLLISAGGLLFPPELLSLNPGLAQTAPVPKGYVFQRRFNPLNNSWSDRGYAEYSSTPTLLRLDKNALAVQLVEMGRYSLGNGNPPYTPNYNPSAIAKIFYRSTTGEKLFEQGNYYGKTVSKNQIDSARPWYAYTTPVNEFSPGAIDIADGSIVFGWKAVKGDNTTSYPLTGGIFDLKLNEIW